MFDVSFDDDWDFQKNSYKELTLAEPVENVDPLFLSQRPFAERVKLLSFDNSTCTYLVDGLIRVTAPSESIRLSATNHWEGKKNEANWWRKFHIGVIVGSVALTALAALAAPPIAVAGVVWIAVGAIFATKNSNRMEAAQKQIDQWNVHPAQSVADERARAYKNGFFYALNLNLKGSFGITSPQNILHPSEVTWLYEQALRDLMNDVITQMQRQNITSYAKTKWVERFISENPLALQSLAYAYEPNDLRRQVLESWSYSFDAYKQDVITTQKSFETRKNQIRSRAQEEIRQLEEQRALALNLPLSLKNASDQEAKRIRDVKIKSIFSTSTIKEINDEYQQALNDNKALYLISTNPINLYYDEKISDIKKTEAAYLQQIDQEKDLGMSPYFEPGLRLFGSAFESWQNRSNDEIYLHQAEPDLYPLPSAPPRGW